MNGKHAIQRRHGAGPGAFVDGDAIDHAAIDQILEHPKQMGRVDAVHRGAQALMRRKAQDGLVGVALSQAVDQMDFGAHGQRTGQPERT